MDIENLRKICEDSIMPIGNMEEYPLAKQLFQSATFRSNVNPRDVLELINEITTLRQQLAEQPNVDVLVEALKLLYSENESYITVNNLAGAMNNQCMVITRKALSTYQSKNEKE